MRRHASSTADAKPAIISPTIEATSGTMSDLKRSEVGGQGPAHHTLRLEDESRADRGMHDLLADRLPRKIIEPVAGAMRRDEMVRVDLLERLDGVADVVVAERRHDVKAADHRVHLVDA